MFGRNVTVLRADALSTSAPPKAHLFALATIAQLYDKYFRAQIHDRW